MKKAQSSILGMVISLNWSTFLVIVRFVMIKWGVRKAIKVENLMKAGRT